MGVGGGCAGMRRECLRVMVVVVVVDIGGEHVSKHPVFHICLRIQFETKLLFGK
jgi:hypothetical protein